MGALLLNLVSRTKFGDNAREGVWGPAPTLEWWPAPVLNNFQTARESLMADAEQEQEDDQNERCAEQPEQDEDHLRLLLYIRVVRSDAVGVRPKPVLRVR